MTGSVRVLRDSGLPERGAQKRAGFEVVCQRDGETERDDPFDLAVGVWLFAVEGDVDALIGNMCMGDPGAMQRGVDCMFDEIGNRALRTPNPFHAPSFPRRYSSAGPSAQPMSTDSLLDQYFARREAFVTLSSRLSTEPISNFGLYGLGLPSSLLSN